MRQKTKLVLYALILCIAISFPAYSQSGNYVKNSSFDDGLQYWQFMYNTTGRVENYDGNNVLVISQGSSSHPRTVFQEIYSAGVGDNSVEEETAQSYILYKNRLKLYGYDDFSAQFVVYVKHKDGSPDSRYESSKISIKANDEVVIQKDLNINEKLGNIQTVYWGVHLYDVHPNNDVIIDSAYFYSNNNEFVKAYGTKLIKGNEEFRLRSIAFTNFYYNEDINNFLESYYFTEDDFKEVADLGLNCVRFALNGDWFNKYNVQDNGNNIWTWMEQAYNWAKKYNLHIIWEMHQTPGASWLSAQEMKSHPPSSTEWIWNSPDKQALLINIWEEIARRYRDSTNIAAYGILNEPKTADTTCGQWYDKETGLGQRLINAIREIDKNHLMVIDECEGSIDPEGKDLYRHDDELRKFSDYNLMYDVHYYSPGYFTHKNASWASGIDLGVNYPDSIWANSVGLWKESNYKSQTHTSAWKTCTSEIDIPTIDVVVINAGVVINDPLGTGCTVYVDNFFLEERKSGEIEFKVIRTSSVTKGYSSWSGVTKEGFYSASWPHWDWDTEDSLAYVNGDDDRKVHDSLNAFVIDKINGQGEGEGENGEEKISLGLTNNYGCITWGHQKFLILPTVGSEYRLRVDMRVAGTIPSGVDISPKIEFYTAKAGVDYGEGWTKSALEKELNDWVTFSVNNAVPISCLEFAASRHCYENTPIDHPVWQGEPWGGVQWINDVFSIFEANNMHWCYWAYRNEAMGLYKNENFGEPLDLLTDLDKNIKLYNAVTGAINNITTE